MGIRIVLRDSNVMSWFRAVVSALKIRTVGFLGLMAKLPNLSKHMDIGLARFLFDYIPIKDKCFVPKLLEWPILLLKCLPVYIATSPVFRGIVMVHTTESAFSNCTSSVLCSSCSVPATASSSTSLCLHSSSSTEAATLFQEDFILLT